MVYTKLKDDYAHSDLELISFVLWPYKLLFQTTLKSRIAAYFLSMSARLLNVSKGPLSENELATHAGMLPPGFNSNAGTAGGHGEEDPARIGRPCRPACRRRGNPRDRLRNRQFFVAGREGFSGSADCRRRH